MTTDRTPAATLVDPAPFDADLWPDGCLQVTVSPEDSDNVLVQVEGVTLDTAEAALVAAFTELARRIAAKVRPLTGATCKWFAMCSRAATRTRVHPILGAVPICGECDAKIARLAGATS